VLKQEKIKQTGLKYPRFAPRPWQSILKNLKTWGIVSGKVRENKQTNRSKISQVCSKASANYFLKF
jgi:hypothetical protein